MYKITELHKKIEAFGPAKIAEIVVQAVTSGSNSSYCSYNIAPNQKPAQTGSPFVSKPYLGPQCHHR